jgi:hypothetical protein
MGRRRIKTSGRPCRPSSNGSSHGATAAPPWSPSRYVRRLRRHATYGRLVLAGRRRQVINTSAACARTALSVRPSTYRPTVEIFNRLWVWTSPTATDRTTSPFATLSWRHSQQRPTATSSGPEANTRTRKVPQILRCHQPAGGREAAYVAHQPFRLSALVLPRSGPADVRFRLTYQAPIAVDRDGVRLRVNSQGLALDTRPTLVSNSANNW